MNFLRLIKLFVFNHARREKFLTILSIAGIALGIGLFVGVQAATDRALIAFEESIQGLNPHANYEVVDMSGVDFNEAVYRKVREIEESSYPLIKTNGYLPSADASIDIAGIYTVKAFRIFGTGTERNYDIERFFRERNGVLITKSFADRYNLSKGDEILADVYDGRYSLKIILILDAPLITPNTVIMDIGNFQDYFGTVGRLTKIDVSANDQNAERIRNILPPNLSIESKSEVVRQQQSLVNSFRYNLQFITFLAVLVGVFLLYNTIFISVVKRRTEIGILRGLGMRKLTVILLFTVKGVMLGLIGSMLGILLGHFFAYFSVMAVERTLSTIYHSISMPDYFITGNDALRAVMLGLLVSFFASLIPSFEAAKVRPNESSKTGSFEKKYRGSQKTFSYVGLLLIASGALLSAVEYISVFLDFPYLSYAGILLLILGCTLIAPVFLSLLLRILRGPAGRLFRSAGKITVGDIEGSRYRFSVALMSVAISTALIFALLSSIYSLKKSFREWLDVYIVADVFIKPASCTSNYCYAPLSGGLYDTVRSFSEVRDVGRLRTLRIDFMGNKVTAGFGDTEMWRKYRQQEHPDSKKLSTLTEGNLISISDYLKVKHGLKLGDTITLQTPKGETEFTVQYTSISYSTTSGFIYLDRKWLNELWGLNDSTQLSVYLKEGTDAGEFIRRLQEGLLNRYSVTIVNNDDLRKNSLEIFDRSFALTYTIELIAIMISLIGVVNTLLILVFEKKREISILRYLGGNWSHIRNIMVLSAGIVGVAGIALGAFMGPAISLIIVHVINKISFGWEVRLQAPFEYLLPLTAVIFLTTLAAGFIPSRVAQKIDPKKFISFE